MIDFLKECGVEEKTIKELERKVSQSNLFDLSCNKDNCLKIIEYLRQININNIDELLLYEFDVFTLTFSTLIKKISQFNVPLLASAINDDPFAIEEIFNV